MIYNLLGGFDGREINPAIHGLRPMEESVNCGPIVLYMLGILNYEEYQSLKLKCNPILGTLPEKIHDIIEKKLKNDMHWLLITGIRNTYLTINATLYLTIKTYLHTMSILLHQPSYATIILCMNIEIGKRPKHGLTQKQFKMGHYNILLYENDEVYIVNPFGYNTCRYVKDILTCNNPTIKTPFLEYMESRSWNEILILHENSKIRWKMPIKSFDGNIMKKINKDDLSEFTQNRIPTKYIKLLGGAYSKKQNANRKITKTKKRKLPF